MISLRPSGRHAALRRAAARHGAGLIALSPWRLQAREDNATRRQLDDALSARYVLFTSPAAVRAASALRSLRAHPGQQFYAVGSGSAMALRRAGIDSVSSPSRMDSDGLLALPGLAVLDGQRVAVVTAPGGRGALLPALQARGATVIRADVYERVAIAPSPRAIAALRGLQVPAVVALSSGEALQRTLASLPADVAAILRRAGVVAASERLATLARESGFERVEVARSPRPADLLAAATPASKPGDMAG